MFVKKSLRYIRVIFIWSVINFIFDDILLFCSGKPIGGLYHFFNLFYQTMCVQSRLIHFWYLWAIIVVYHVSFLLVALCRHFRVKNYVFKCWLILATICALMQLWSYSIHKSIFVENSIKNVLKVWTYAQYFFLGGCLPIFSNYINKLFKSVALHILVAIVSILAITYYFTRTLPIFFGDLNFVKTYDSPLVIILIIIITTLFYRLKPNNKHLESVISFISPLTFGIYIIHTFVISCISNISPATCYPRQSFFLWILSFALSAVLVYFLKKIPIVKSAFSL